MLMNFYERFEENGASLKTEKDHLIILKTYNLLKLIGITYNFEIYAK